LHSFFVPHVWPGPQGGSQVSVRQAPSSHAAQYEPKSAPTCPRSHARVSSEHGSEAPAPQRQALVFVARRPHLRELHLGGFLDQLVCLLRAVDRPSVSTAPATLDTQWCAAQRQRAAGPLDPGLRAAAARRREGRPRGGGAPSPCRCTRSRVAAGLRRGARPAPRRQAFVLSF